MAARRYYAVRAYGFPGHPFPSRFYDAEPTLAHARRTASNLVRDGWRCADILRELPRPPGHEIGAHWEPVETLGVA